MNNSEGKARLFERQGKETSQEKWHARQHTLFYKKILHAFFYKKVVYKKVLLDRTKPSKELRKF